MLARGPYGLVGKPTISSDVTGNAHGSNGIRGTDPVDSDLTHQLNDPLVLERSWPEGQERHVSELPNPLCGIVSQGVA